VSNKKKIGLIVSDKMDKTRIILVTRRVRHKRYKKIVTKVKRYPSHDPRCITRRGDRVLIEQTAPISKTKCWNITKIFLSNGKAVPIDFSRL
jgi:small subunit ribosomal protein S17